MAIRIVTPLNCTEKNVGTGNWDATRTTIDRIIIHTMVGSAASAASRFYNSTSGVSAHYGVLLDGSIWHWVDEDNTAYHAGDYAMNQRSIGIEHEDNGDFNGLRTDALYTTSAKLVRDICLFYNIPIDRAHILKHSEVIATGCPDALDIERIVSEANGTPSQQNLIDQLRADRDKNWNLYQQQLQHTIDQETIIAAKQKAIDNITKENLELKDQCKQASDQHQTDLGVIQGLTNDRNNLSKDILDLQSNLAKTMNDLQTCQISKNNLSYATKTQLIKELLKRFKL